MHTTYRLAALVLAATCVAPAMAQDFQSPAATACRGALPVYEGNLRARPLALQNEGSASAFVTCGQQTEPVRAYGRSAVRLVNNTDAPITISCTLIDGYEGGTTPRYLTTTSTLAPRTSGWVIDTPAGGFSTAHIAYSCVLPPGAGVARISQQQA